MKLKSKCCGTCEHFAFALSVTNRNLPLRPGSCQWPVPWPGAWPVAYRHRVFMPHPVVMYPREGGNCECYAEAGKAVR